MGDQPVSQRSKDLDDIIETLDFARMVFTPAFQRILAARTGYPSSGNGGGGGGSSSPVERALLGPNCTCGDECSCPADVKPDVGRATIRRIDHDLRELVKLSNDLFAVVKNWSPHEPSAKDRIDAEALNERTCKLCETHGVPGVTSKIQRSDIGGLLQVPTDSCEWHRRWSTSAERLPTKDEVMRHSRGGKVPVPAGKRMAGSWSGA